MAQAEYEDTPEVARTRSWKVGESARRMITRTRDDLRAAHAARRPECELRALVAHQARLLDQLLNEAKWAQHVEIHGEVV